MVERAVGGGKSLVLLQGLACGGMIALAPVAMAHLALSLAPGLAMMVVERRPGRPIARGMLLFGLAASVEPIRRFWGAGATLDRIWDSSALLWTWGLAGFGWLLATTVPAVVELAVMAAHRARAETLRATREELTRVWGLDEES
jgi:hypothetical protein